MIKPLHLKEKPSKIMGIPSQRGHIPSKSPPMGQQRTQPSATHIYFGFQPSGSSDPLTPSPPLKFGMLEFHRSDPRPWEHNPEREKGRSSSSPGAWAHPGGLTEGRNVGPLFLRSPDRTEREGENHAGGSSAPDGSTSQQGYTDCQESAASSPLLQRGLDGT